MPISNIRYEHSSLAIIGGNRETAERRSQLFVDIRCFSGSYLHMFALSSVCGIYVSPLVYCVFVIVLLHHRLTL
jgi:hypothetical protein